MTDENQIDRRSVLKSMAAGATVLAGASGLGAATTGKAPVSRFERDAAVRGFESPEAMRSVLSDHEDMLETLAAEGLIESASVDALTLDPEGAVRDEGHEHVTAVRRTDGSVTAELKFTRATDEGVLTVGVRPETGTRWALHGEFDSKEPVVHDVSTMSCCSCCGYDRYCCGDWFCDTDCTCTEWCYECSCPDDCC